MLTVRSAEYIVVDDMTVTTGDLRVAGGVVVGGEGADTAMSGSGGHEVIDATGCVVTPGLVNAHHHLLQSAFRTLPGTRGVPMANWLPTMAAAYSSAVVDSELCGVAASVGVAEALLSGVTTVADHHLTWPAGARVDDTVEMARATVAAARTFGGRITFVRGSAHDEPQEAAISAEAIVHALVPNGEGGVMPGGVSADGMVQVAIGPAGVHSDSRETFDLFSEVARRYGLRRRTQANEQVDVEIALERYKRRPLDVLDEWGWLAPDVTLAHLCAVTNEEIGRLAMAGITATHAPGCDLPMGWGIAPVAALREAGIRVGLGTSGGGSNDAGHLLADARLAMQVAPLIGPAIPALAVIGMATEGSALGLGRTDIGHLRPGAAADVCVWDVSAIADAGVSDPVAGLLWASPGRRPKYVIVGGHVVVRDYRLVDADEAEIISLLRSRMATTAY